MWGDVLSLLSDGSDFVGKSCDLFFSDIGNDQLIELSLKWMVSIFQTFSQLCYQRLLIDIVLAPLSNIYFDLFDPFLILDYLSLIIILAQDINLLPYTSNLWAKLFMTATNTLSHSIDIIVDEAVIESIHSFIPNFLT